MVIKFDPDGRVIMTMGAGNPRRSAYRQRRPLWPLLFLLPAGIHRAVQVAVPREEGAGPGPVREGGGPAGKRPRALGLRATISTALRMWLGTQPEIFSSRMDITIREWRNLTKTESISSPGDPEERSPANSTPCTRSRQTPRATCTSATAKTGAFKFSTMTGTSNPCTINIGAPWAVCITPGQHQYLYSSTQTAPRTWRTVRYIKMELDGKILGKFGTAGKTIEEFGSVHEIDCRNQNEFTLANSRIGESKN